MDQSFGIQHWLPIQGSMIRGWSLFDKYESRCALSPGMEHALVAEDDKGWELIKSSVVQAKRCKRYFFGDYYPLTNQQRNPAAWTAYHLYLPAERAGMLVALRREKSDTQAMTFDLLTMDPTLQWQFEDYDTGQTWIVSGQALRQNGFEVVIPNRRDSRLIFYSAVPTLAGK